MKHGLGTLVGLGMLALASDARAWETLEGEGEVDPAYGTESWSDVTATRPKRRMYGALDLGIPVVMNVDRDLIRPGVDLHAEGGVDLGWFAFFVHGGFRWVPVDYARAAQHGNGAVNGSGGREPLKNPYVGLGPRFQLPNSTRFLPYVSGSFDFNFWNLDETDTACASGYYYWYCDTYNVYKFTPGFTGRIGTGIGIAYGIYLDVGLSTSMSFEGAFFDSAQWWMQPYIGVMQRI